jgi:hypothetical protein
MNLDLLSVLFTWPGLTSRNRWEGLLITFLIYSDKNMTLSRFLLNQLSRFLENVEEVNLILDQFISKLATYPTRVHGPFVKVFIDAELVANTRSHERRSVMTSVCAQNIGNIFHSLLEQGYRIDAMNSQSYFEALSGASRNGHGDVVNILLAHDSNVELREAESYREVVQALTMSQSGIILSSLLDRSKGFRTQDRATYRGPLRQATQLSFHEIVRILRDRGVTLPED